MGEEGLFMPQDWENGNAATEAENVDVHELAAPVLYEEVNRIPWRRNTERTIHPLDRIVYRGL